MKLIIGITGASGVIYSKRLLEELKNKKIETHLVISQAAKKIIKFEFESSEKKIEELASFVHEIDDWSCPIVSGSFKTDGMIIIPCSMKTLAGIANGFATNVILRAADVCLKEKRKLVLMVRETPLHKGHLRLMCRAADMGAHILPPIPAFYHKIEDDLLPLVELPPDRIPDLVGRQGIKAACE